MLSYPLINGHRHDFSSVELVVAAERIQGVKSIDYDHALEPGEIRGNRAQVIGRTRGKYSANASVELYLSEYQALIARLTSLSAPLGGGYMEAAFDIVVNYTELSGLATDYLAGCRIKKSSKSGQEGSADGISVKVELSVMYITESGMPALGRTMLK